jgi:hypothetical protein
MSYRKLFVPVLIIACCIAPASLWAKFKHIKLKEALKKKIVAIKGIGKGGARGKCLELQLTNNSSQPVQIEVDPAMIFSPSDTNYQDLVAAGSESIALEPKESGCLELETFCGKSYARCPVSGLDYSFYRQGDEAMINTMNFMRDNNMLDALGQKAVWSFTNNHPLNSIYDVGQQDRSRQLVEYIAVQRNIPVPEYFTERKLDFTPGAAMIVPNTAKYYVEMSWDKKAYGGKMNVLVYHKDGRLYKQINDGEICDHSGHKITVKFDPKVDKGDFVVVLKDDYSNIWSRKEVSVQED